MIPLPGDEIFHPAPPLILRFASDAELDNVLAPHSVGLCARLCASFLREFFEDNMRGCENGIPEGDLQLFGTNVNFVAHLVNLGYVEEAVIRDHILQSLTSYPRAEICHHQVYALTILFKLAGATFERYVDPSVVDSCIGHLFRRWDADGYMEDNPVLVRVVSRNERLEQG